MMRKIAIAAAAALMLAACSSDDEEMGELYTYHDPDPDSMIAMHLGHRVALRLCILKDGPVADDRIDHLVGLMDEEFNQFELDVEIAWVKDWERPGFFHQTIYDDLIARPLDPECDRLVAMVGRHFGDALTGAVFPETLGTVDERTHTRGYLYTESFNLLQAMNSPDDIMSGQAWQFLGCGAPVTVFECKRQVVRLKGQAASLHRAGTPFFPGIDREGRFLTTREQVDEALAVAIAEREQEKREGFFSGLHRGDGEEK